jgi:hypothetical protein
VVNTFLVHGLITVRQHHFISGRDDVSAAEEHLIGDVFQSITMSLKRFILN